MTPPAPTPATGPSPSAPSAPTLAAGRATLTGSRRLRVDRRHRVRVLLRCPAGTSGCIGVVALRLGKATFARSAFRLKAGTTTKLRLTVRSSAVRRATTAKARPVALVDGRSTRLRLVR